MQGRGVPDCDSDLKASSGATRANGKVDDELQHEEDFLEVKVYFQDYDRDSKILGGLDPFDVLVLCCKMQILSHNSCSEDRLNYYLSSSNSFIEREILYYYSTRLRRITDHNIEAAHMDTNAYAGILIPEPSYEESSS
ncbi:hypothetical protein Tco_0735438 [Tanacetum coccineum]